MAEKAPVTLTKKFNEATVKAGDTFQVNLVEGGIAGVMWATQVVSGNATLLSESSQQIQPFYDGQSIQQRVYRAEEAGEIEIVAKSKYESLAFKVRVN